MKEGTATVKIIYRVNKVLADGSHPFLIRITKNRKQIFRATGLSLHPRHWNENGDELRDRIRKNYPDPQREQLLTKLRAWEDKYRTAATTLADADEQHDAAAVLTKATEDRKQTRRVLLLAYIEELAATAKTLGNASVYRDCANQLRKFIKAEHHADDVPFDRITVAFCDQWERALRTAGNEDITLSNRFRTLRAILNKAIANGVMKPDRYPFARTVADQHKFKVGKFDVSTAKRAIPRESISLLEAFEPTTDRHRLAKNVFLFSFYCGGINFVDLAQLRWSDLTAAEATGHQQRLNYVRQKTGGKFSLRLLPPAAAIVMAYRPFTYAGPTSYLFPVLDLTKHQTPTQIKNRLHKVLGQVNQDLKAIGELVGISTPLTTYVARHSFATSLKQNGVSTGVISEMMGHQSEAVTAIYLNSFASETVDAAYEQLL